MTFLFKRLTWLTNDSHNLIRLNIDSQVFDNCHICFRWIGKSDILNAQGSSGAFLSLPIFAHHNLGYFDDQLSNFVWATLHFGDRDQIIWHFTKNLH